MKVKQLIKELEKLNPDCQVILQRDSEGNGYSPLWAVDGDCVYIPDSNWSGSVFDTKWSADDACMDEADWKKLKAKKHCVVLAPVN